LILFEWRLDLFWRTGLNDELNSMAGLCALNTWLTGEDIWAVRANWLCSPVLMAFTISLWTSGSISRHLACTKIKALHKYIPKNKSCYFCVESRIIPLAHRKSVQFISCRLLGRLMLGVWGEVKKMLMDWSKVVCQQVSWRIGNGHILFQSQIHKNLIDNLNLNQ
jgi:hypothetical protein